MASGLIDVAATILLLVGVLLVALVASRQADAALEHVAQIGSVILVFLVFPTTLETLTHGRSLGKLALGLRVVRDDAGPVTVHQSFVRALIGFVEIYLLFAAPAFLSALVSSKGKRLGDHAAGTYVVRERVRLELPQPPVMPPPLAAWARTADIASLPAGLALAVRQLVGRFETIDPATRRTLADRLAAEVAP